MIPVVKREDCKRVQDDRMPYFCQLCGCPASGHPFPEDFVPDGKV